MSVPFSGPGVVTRRRSRRLARVLALVALMGLWATPARAQAGLAGAPDVPRVEFDAALRQALQKNPTIGQAAVAVARAEALVAQARALTLPSVSASLTNVTLDSARSFSGGVTQPQNQFTFGANVRYEVGGWLGVNHAEDQAAVATASSAEARQRVAVATAQTFLAVIASRRQVEVAMRALEVSGAHLEYANRRLEGGAGSRLNQLRAAQAVTADEFRLENARLALRRAQEALGVVLVEDGPIDAGAEPVFAAVAASDGEAWRGRPDLRTLDVARRAAERVVKDSWADWVPLPVVSFDPALVAPRGLFQPSRTYRLTVQMVQPLFDNGLRRSRLRSRQTVVEQASVSFMETEVRARAEVRIAQASIASLERALVTARAAGSQAQEVLRITTAAFELGATTNIEVLDAQRSARDAESSAVIAEDAVRRAQLDLLVALGRF